MSKKYKILIQGKVEMYKASNNLGKLIRMLRLFYDIKQNELSNTLDIAPSYLCDIEQGKKIPSLELIEKLAKAFNIPASVLMFFSENLYKNRKLERARDFLSGKSVTMINLLITLNNKNKGGK
jgi:transcriptional regulator with XRE-family HTH domain